MFYWYECNYYFFVNLYLDEVKSQQDNDFSNWYQTGWAYPPPPQYPPAARTASLPQKGKFCCTLLFYSSYVLVQVINSLG